MEKTNYMMTVDDVAQELEKEVGKRMKKCFSNVEICDILS